MSTAKKISGIALATAAAGFFALAPISGAVAEDAKVHCMGVNSCKGNSACATANSSCKGQNACKGQGWMELTKADCDEQGGTVES